MIGHEMVEDPPIKTQPCLHKRPPKRPSAVAVHANPLVLTKANTYNWIFSQAGDLTVFTKIQLIGQPWQPSQLLCPISEAKIKQRMYV